MTTPPIMSVTDELIAELERLCAENDDASADDSAWVDGFTIGDFKALLSERAEYRRLLAEQERIMQSLRDSECALMNEVAELKRDAERYRHYREGFEDPASFDANVDAAMQK